MQPRDQAVALNDMIWHFPAGGIDKGCGQVNRFHQRVAGRAAGWVCRWTWVIDDHRNFCGCVVKEVLLAEPMVT